jgi:DNA (cytosine-5)-methyltransferase 1
VLNYFLLEKSMNHIELFAGCGGLSLWLKAAKFKLLFANELSPMAAETFAFNLLDENLSEIASIETLSRPALKTKWIASKYPLSQLTLRLRENQQDFLAAKPESDLKFVADLQESLIVGSIVQLNQWLSAAPVAGIDKLRSGFGAGQIDLVSGGPPCQSFSMNGLRDYSNSRNNLPWEFAKFVELAQPRFALLENVTGILRPFQVDGRKVFAWFEVAKAFAEIGYVPLCLHVNAKYAGVAQNRPRFLMILFREDVYAQVKRNLDQSGNELLGSAGRFFEKHRNSGFLSISDLDVFDVEKPEHLALYRKSFLAPLVAQHGAEFSVTDAIDDLWVTPAREVPSTYVRLLSESLGGCIRQKVRSNAQFRKHTPLVQRRFRIYQNLVEVTKKSVLREIRGMLRGSIESLSKESFEALSGLRFISEENEETGFVEKRELEKFLIAHSTRKQKQCALDATLPAPAALSIPDDACHYYERRTLSVREMARIQSFPDNFEFRSKVTTGGESRKFEVPQYTQVGNAVPPLLGLALGQVFRSLDKLSQAVPPQAELMREDEFLLA